MSILPSINSQCTFPGQFTYCISLHLPLTLPKTLQKGTVCFINSTEKRTLISHTCHVLQRILHPFAHLTPGVLLPARMDIPSSLPRLGCEGNDMAHRTSCHFSWCRNWSNSLDRSQSHSSAMHETVLYILVFLGTERIRFKLYMIKNLNKRTNPTWSTYKSYALVSSCFISTSHEKSKVCIVLQLFQVIHHWLTKPLWIYFKEETVV